MVIVILGFSLEKIFLNISILKLKVKIELNILFLLIDMKMVHLTKGNKIIVKLF